MLSVQGVLSWLFRAWNGFLRPCLFFFPSSSRLLRCIILCFALHVFHRDKFPQVVSFLLVISFPNRGQARVCRTTPGLKRQRTTRDGNDENEHIPHGGTPQRSTQVSVQIFCVLHKSKTVTRSNERIQNECAAEHFQKKTPCRVAVLDTQALSGIFLETRGPPSAHPFLPCTLRCLLLLCLLRPSADARARHVSRQKTR